MLDFIGSVVFYLAREVKLFFHTIAERPQLPATVTSFPVHSGINSRNAHWENKVDRQKMETETEDGNRETGRHRMSGDPGVQYVCILFIDFTLGTTT